MKIVFDYVVFSIYKMSDLNIVITLLFLILTSCYGNQKEFKGGRQYKIKSERLEELDRRTKNHELWRKMDSCGLDTIVTKRNTLGRKNKYPVRVKVKTTLQFY